LVVSDVVPNGAHFVDSPNGTVLYPHGTLSSGVVYWTIDSLIMSTSLEVGFVVTATQTILNDNYSVYASGGYSAVGSEPLLTIVSNDIASGTINTDSGGAIVSDNGAINVQFPSNAVSKPVTVTITTASNSVSGSGFVGHAFDITAMDANNEDITGFNQPFSLTLIYDDADWQNAGIQDENNLNLYFWDGSRWTPTLPCTECLHDTTDNKFIVWLNHLTLFALRERQEHFMYLPIVLRNMN
jgi:hypothetical protein